jgi:2-polyprenyl-3-methyl-5-hydroxy-6-metoxy-1,4-benzoquinol methylase
MALKDLYTSGAYLDKVPTWHVEESADKTQEILRALDRNHLVPRTICDIGCGAGAVLADLQRALPQSCQLAGYDVSPQAIELAQGRANERLHYFLGAFPPSDAARFDLLLVLDVIEHLEDYFSFLRHLQPLAEHKLFFFPLDLSVQSVIRPHGLLHTREAYGHLHYFTKETAIQVLQETGYTVLDAVYTADALNRPTREFGRRLLKYPRKLAFALHQDLAVHLLGGYRLLVLAR